MERRTIPVGGMGCGGCERAVIRALDALPGVERALADHVAEEVEVEFDPARVTPDELRAAVREAGFAA
jgi:copper chaperone CopZ